MRDLVQEKVLRGKSLHVEFLSSCRRLGLSGYGGTHKCPSREYYVAQLLLLEESGLLVHVLQHLTFWYATCPGPKRGLGQLRPEAVGSYWGLECLSTFSGVLFEASVVLELGASDEPLHWLP